MAEQRSGELLRSPLHERHVALGAKFASFGGWSMPLEYTGTVKEHLAVRQAVGIFDVSHLGKAVVRGPGAAAYVNDCLTNDLGKIGPGRAQYTLCCTESGGVVDDLIVYLRADDEVFLIPNAANTAAVVELLTTNAPPGVEAVDQHFDFAVLAVQGPASPEALAASGFPVDHPYMSFRDVEHDGVPVVICRTGYTGERGFELVVPAAAATAVWDAIVSAGEQYGIAPAGLAARDTLRTEMGYPLHGQDLSASITPLQARLGWAVGWKKAQFWGDRALRAERSAGPSRVLQGSSRTVAVSPAWYVRAQLGHEGDRSCDVGDVLAVTEEGVALALLDPGVVEGETVVVDVRGRREPFTVTRPPFVRTSMREES